MSSRILAVLQPSMAVATFTFALTALRGSEGATRMVPRFLQIPRKISTIHHPGSNGPSRSLRKSAGNRPLRVAARSDSVSARQFSEV